MYLYVYKYIYVSNDKHNFIVELSCLISFYGFKIRSSRSERFV